MWNKTVWPVELSETSLCVRAGLRWHIQTWLTEKNVFSQVISDRLSNQYRLIIFNAKELDEDIFQYVKKLNESNKDIGKPIVLLVDDADEYGNQLRFISFLGFLRNNYLEREKFGQKSTIHSVILACKQDIRNIVVYDSFGDRVKNSPWNIAADFNVDMTFHPEEIAQMLGDYENDTHTGMDEGYLVTFDFSKNKEEKEPEWIEWNGKRIFEAVI